MVGSCKLYMYNYTYMQCQLITVVPSANSLVVCRAHPLIGQSLARPPLASPVREISPVTEVFEPSNT